MAKGNSGSRRWIQRRPIDRRPIVGLYDIPKWQQALEEIAPAGCIIMASLALAVGAYAWAADLLAGHIR
jgi:hypothetical protein